MSRDDIIRLARDAGFKASVGKTDKDGKYHPDVNALSRDVPVEWLERFAALVADAEREACAKVLEDTKEWKGGGWISTLSPQTKTAIATAIRARGQA